jgi:uncharacterized UPF0160 family protein
MSSFKNLFGGFMNFVAGNNKKTIIAHSGSCHADDVFAVATLVLWCKKHGCQYQIIRTRDENKIAEGNFVVDVGGIYDETLSRFDHHQKGGAGVRENTIPYASFGLVWKTYGTELAGDAEIAERFDIQFVSPIDAIDNGVSVYKKLFDDISVTDISSIVSMMQPTWQEVDTTDEVFLDLVALAQKIITRKLAHIRGQVALEVLIKDAYEKSPDKRVIILDTHVQARYALIAYPEPLFVISPRSDGGWSVYTVPVEFNSFESRKSLPREWSGLKGEELQSISGVSDALFCHKDCFLCAAESREGAIALVEKALQ